MTDDLVKRLRDGCSCNIDSSPCMAEEECRDAYAAADRIEALEAELAKAHLALNYFLMRDPDKPTYWEYRRDRAEELARDVLETTQELTGGKDD